MLTETTMKIISHSNNHLTLQLNNCNKLIYKQYTSITQQTQDKLMHLLSLKHQHILPIHKIQRFQNHCGSVTLGIYYQYYAGLDKFLVSLQGGYEEQQVVNTFQPIIQAVQYLINNGYTITAIKQKNIVITQNQQIKFVDNCLLDPTKNKNEIIDKSKIYEELSQIIFNVLIMEYKEKCLKSWKSRLQVLKRKFSKDTYIFFMGVFNKSVVGAIGVQKTKKISKKQRALQGKQNKIISANN